MTDKIYCSECQFSDVDYDCKCLADCKNPKCYTQYPKKHPIVRDYEQDCNILNKDNCCKYYKKREIIDTPLPMIILVIGLAVFAYVFLKTLSIIGGF